MPGTRFNSKLTCIGHQARFLTMFTNYVGLFKSIHESKSSSHLVKPGERVKEIVNCHLALNPCPWNMFVDFTHRQLDYGYIAAQLAWYLRARPYELDGIDAYSSSWSRILEPDINSNYGVYVFSSGQWAQAVIDRLKQDLSSRQAIILFNRPSINMSSTADHICTTSMQFLIREHRLLAIVTMRSNDLWNGLCYDIPFFLMLQEMTFILLNEAYPWLMRGPYYHNVGSLHAYERDWPGIAKIVNDPTRDVRDVPIFETVADVKKILNDLGPTEEALRKACITAQLDNVTYIPVPDKLIDTSCPVFSWHITKIIDKLCQIYCLPSATTHPPSPTETAPLQAMKQSG